ncbi:MAG: UDP-N-acetylglucosamine 1-carboxyvinyltransferase [Oscillospiraceae bacterium]|nr:UDP-N-acetylglucosamine 1-carboxyvinyltransferase [Oscillospiraceae bacterium]
MQHLTVYGGHRLNGSLAVHGAKNSALPILAATLLCRGECAIERCPNLSDVEAAMVILRKLGCEVRREGTTVFVRADHAVNAPLDYAQTGKMRASVNFIGAMLGRFGSASVAQPGGCVLGQRPIDYHLSALEAMGAAVSDGENGCELHWSKPCDCEWTLPFPSVGATENVLLAAVSAPISVTLHGAAQEPEICDLCRFLQAAGADISGVGTKDLHIRGGSTLRGVRHTLISDRIETATYLAACAACGGSITLQQTAPQTLAPVLALLECAGCTVSTSDTSICLTCEGRLSGFGTVVSDAYPAFPTDAQAPLMAAATLADGISIFEERVFPERFRHAAQLKRFGAAITLQNSAAIVQGVSHLHGAEAKATDLRGGAGVLIAALAAKGESILHDTFLLDRGYDGWMQHWIDLGAEIFYETDEE